MGTWEEERDDQANNRQLAEPERAPNCNVLEGRRRVEQGEERRFKNVEEASSGSV
jgi:hypothetical protein